ncbi:MAG: hypothetical protein SH850_24980 [Planctomycetaceae bacterium]|nr:hypothetical protein [Planctomycetaceae bacterium]
MATLCAAAGCSLLRRPAGCTASVASTVSTARAAGPMTIWAISVSSG